MVLIKLRTRITHFWLVGMKPSVGFAGVGGFAHMDGVRALRDPFQGIAYIFNNRYYRRKLVRDGDLYYSDLRVQPPTSERSNRLLAVVMQIADKFAVLRSYTREKITNT